MSIVLGPNQYGKAENRVVRIYRDTDRHVIRDLNVSTSLRGNFTAAHVDGDQSAVLPTDTQKNTAFAFAKEHGVTSPEDYALTLAAHFLDAATAATAATGARVEVEEYAWDRIPVGGKGHDHAFVRRGGDTRTTVVTVEGTGTDQRAWVVSGLKDLVVLKSTGSEFKGYPRDRYTTLPEADDRILATSLVARWRYAGADAPGGDWTETFDDVRRILLETFATTTAEPFRSPCMPWARRCCRLTRRSPSSSSPRRTSTTSSSTSARSASRTRARSSSRPTARTASSRPR